MSKKSGVRPAKKEEGVVETEIAIAAETGVISCILLGIVSSALVLLG